MKTVKEISEISGISIRTLRYYDEIGLLKPSALTEANYRLYDEATIEKLQQILFFRELEIPLADIKLIMENPRYDKEYALKVQKKLLEHKRNRLNGIIELIDDVIEGVNTMSFEAFNDEDIEKILDHAMQEQSQSSVEAVSKQYGSIDAFRAFVGQELKEQTLHYAKLYGGKEKAINALLKSPLDQSEISHLKNENDKIYWQFAKAMTTDDEDMATDAVERLADWCKRMFRLDNARYLLLKMAENYLHEHRNIKLIKMLNQKYGDGLTEYIGHSIQRYYGV